MGLTYVNDDADFGELQIYFDTNTWNINKDGLIYTDDACEKQIREILRKKGFSDKAARSVSYSEQGMQGRDYISLDCGQAFISEWQAKFGDK